MPKPIYYAEIRNKIATEMLNNAELLAVFEKDAALVCEENMYTLCSEAAQIFETIQQLSKTDNLIPISRAVSVYTDTFLQQLLRGEKPLIIDLIVMASQTIQQFC
ncbi:hypothetical protein DVK85_01575 [Flavobacterium arcticum]|uniref:Uncharacterized protein n=1 Tax=Flavobacterium arcticum TaxID=1784713 RepID=A0A345H8T2_9FLAO|nr:hypothetical protein [Flavobacterium arcticum]AXG72992.1 hypothetical protein DVK85_01575 [Flavobacterium arcticum]KAF2510344.1 hypothetical protein E0W72_07630 [Flavobacterium arcticum]